MSEFEMGFRDGQRAAWRGEGCLFYDIPSDYERGYMRGWLYERYWSKLTTE